MREIVLDPFVGIGVAVNAPLKSKIWKGDFWCRLSSSLGNTPILPSLGAASLLSPTSFKHRPFDTGVLRLLNPSIRELNIILPQCESDQITVQKALSDCFSLFHNLEVLSVETPVPALDLGSLAQSHHRLGYLRLDTNFQVSASHLTLLATFKSLQYLSIDLSPQAPLNSPVAFTRLRILAVSGNQFGAICAFVAHMDAPRLRSFSMFETHTDSSTMHPEVGTILRTLVVKCPFLMAFEWESQQSLGIPAEEVDSRSRVLAMLAELIGPLLSHPTLRSFSAHFRSPTVLYTPADVREMAEAWPDIEAFCLYYSGSRRVNQYADLESVIAFARCCPRLRTLHLPDVVFDLDSVQAAVEELHGPSAPHALRNLWSGDPSCVQGKRMRTAVKRVKDSSAVGWRRCFRLR